LIGIEVVLMNPRLREVDAKRLRVAKPPLRLAFVGRVLEQATLEVRVALHEPAHILANHGNVGGSPSWIMMMIGICGGSLAIQ
jgi:hypothetical protein